MEEQNKQTLMAQQLLETVQQRGSMDIWSYIAERFEDTGAAKKQVNALLQQGELVRLKSGKVATPEQVGYVRGPLEIKRGGFGFVRHSAGDVFIPEKALQGAFHGELVLAKVTQESRKGKEGRIAQIISRLPYRVVGRYCRNKKGRPFVWVEENGDYKVWVRNAKQISAKNNEIVVVDILKRATEKQQAEGDVTEVLGKESKPGVDILSIARSYGLYAEFPDGVQAEAEDAPDTVSEAALQGRELLFDKQIFTIDGADAKDLDDAVSLERTENGNYILGVHIADVSHYVQPGSALDKEAFRRGTSVYLVDQVIPMLPKRLSNGICSLNPNEVRLTMSCFMEIDGQGRVRDQRFASTAIRSCHRLTYDEVNDWLEDGDGEAAKRFWDIAALLKEMQDLAAILREKRQREGNIDFDVPEAKIYLDENKRPTEIRKRVQRTAERLIEEFMICCNCAVAAAFAEKGAAMIYRVHDRPDGEKLEALRAFLENFGYNNTSMTNRELQRILQDCTGKPNEHIIKTVALRSMKKAIYSEENRGHFGLGAAAYSHFTSPIRRYPDLIAHRLVKRMLGMDAWAGHPLPLVASQCNTQERSAIEAERKVDDIKKAEYMADHIGEVFTGRVSGVTQYGLYVELENTVEGMIPLSAMRDDYYHYIEEHYCVVGKRTRRKISLGDEMRVKVMLADKSVPVIEFAEARIPKKKKV